ncbi:MAG: virulence RhuM family protein [Defluviitaleaceae bacterium]|nr:virulence RhuM family protein [Defluviitaleaceae bacterium]
MNQIILFKTEDEKISVNVRFDEETVWLSQQQIAELFGTSRTSIVEHIKHIYAEGELVAESTCRNFRQVRFEGERQVTRTIPHYDLDMIISIGYRVNSLRATQFRQWATKRLNEYIRKGFALDDERLKNGGGRYFRELLQRIRDIRSSERNLYQQVTDIYATATDYDSKAPITREFFATVQNKMHYAAHKHTAAEVIFERVDSEKPHVGMTNFKGDYVTKSDVSVAKNYLTEREITILNLLVSQFLDFAELQALEERPMKMADWIGELDNQLSANRRELLKDKGKISRKQAIEKAEGEFEIYRAREMRQLVSDFDRTVKGIFKDEAVGNSQF